MRVLGVTCDSDTVYMAVADDGDLIPELPERVQVPGGVEREARLDAVFEDVGRVLDQVRPDVVRLLRPEATYKASHEQFTRRIALETLLRLAATRRGIPLDRVSRQSLRSELGLPKKGSLDGYTNDVIPQPSGGHWREGRGLAAMVAVGMGTD